jgi:hypothetical protein
MQSIALKGPVVFCLEIGFWDQFRPGSELTFLGWVTGKKKGKETDIRDRMMTFFFRLFSYFFFLDRY